MAPPPPPGPTAAAQYYLSNGGAGAGTGGSYGGNSPNVENNLRGSWFAGRYGGSMGAMNNELNRTDSAALRGASLDLQGQANEAQMGQLGQAFADQGAANADISAGLRGAAAGNYGQQLGARQQTQEGLDRLRAFYQQGPGPSVAEAQMRGAADANMGAAFASRGRGDMRGAMAQGAAGMQGVGNNLANARAAEESAFRGQRMGAMGLEQQGYGNMRAGDINAMNQNLGAAQGYGNLGLGYNEMGAKSIGQGMHTAGSYATLGENTMEAGEQNRQNLLLQQQQNDVAQQNAQRLAALASARADQQSDAATLGMVGTGVGAGAGFLFGGPPGAVVGAGIGSKASDVRMKRSILPMPQNYGVSY